MTQDPFSPRPGSTPEGYGPPPGPAAGGHDPAAGSPYGPPTGQPGGYGPQTGQGAGWQGGGWQGGGEQPGGYGPQTGQGGGWQPGGHGPPGPTGPTSTEPKAWIALLCAVLAYTPTVPFIGAIAALFLARSARRDILASGGRLTGLSFCTWAVVLSWVHLAFVGLFFLLFLVFVVAGLALPFGLSAL